MRKLSLVVAGLCLAAAVVPAFADGSNDQLRTRRVDLLRRGLPDAAPPEEGVKPTTGVRDQTSQLQSEIANGDAPVTGIEALELVANTVPMDQSLVLGPLMDLSGFHALDRGLAAPTQPEVLAHVRRELSSTYCLDFPVVARR